MYGRWSWASRTTPRRNAPIHHAEGVLARRSGIKEQFHPVCRSQFRIILINYVDDGSELAVVPGIPRNSPMIAGLPGVAPYPDACARTGTGRSRRNT